MFLFFRLLAQLRVRLFQKPGGLEYRLRGGQKIKISAGTGSGLLLRLGRKKMCLDYGL